MGKFSRWLQRRKSRFQGIPVLQSYEQQQEKFRRKYPHYEIGIGTYGFPIVHDDNEGTTLRIGAYCSIASGVQIFLGNHHRTDWVTSFPFPAFFNEARHITKYGVSRGDVNIGSDVWLCANCTILSGVSVGHGAVIGTGAVVTRNVEPYSIMAGNPAKIVRYRFDEATRQALQASVWWEWPLKEVLGVVELLCSDQVEELLTYAKKRKC
jgi:acetyltransferase-like isoleucine patch superfamily enzyme